MTDITNLKIGDRVITLGSRQERAVISEVIKPGVYRVNPNKRCCNIYYWHQLLIDTEEVMGSFELKSNEESAIKPGTPDSILKSVHSSLQIYISDLKHMRVSAEVTLTLRKLQEANLYLEEDFKIRGIEF